MLKKGPGVLENGASLHTIPNSTCKFHLCHATPHPAFPEARGEVRGDEAAREPLTTLGPGLSDHSFPSNSQRRVPQDRAPSFMDKTQSSENRRDGPRHLQHTVGGGGQDGSPGTCVSRPVANSGLFLTSLLALPVNSAQPRGLASGPATPNCAHGPTLAKGQGVWLLVKVRASQVLEGTTGRSQHGDWPEACLLVKPRMEGPDRVGKRPRRKAYREAAKCRLGAGHGGACL